MNMQSEIDYFTELRLIDKARLLNLFLHELAEEARGASSMRSTTSSAGRVASSASSCSMTRVRRW